MAFTWLDKFTEACDTIPDEADRARFIVGVVDYATHGTDPCFEYPLSFAWAAMKEDIDASLRMHRNGGKGGRPRKGAAEESKRRNAGAAEESKRENAGAAGEDAGGDSVGNPLPKPPLETQNETGLKPGLETQNETGSKPPLETPLQNPKQSKAKQSRAKQSNSLAGGKRDGGRFSPPSPSDVSAYAEGVCKGFDAQRFVDYYAAQGWRLSNGRPMRDWRAAVRNWARRDAARPQPPPGGQADWSMYD